MFKMSTIHANTCIQTTMPLRNRCRDVVQQPPLPQQTFFHLLHIMGLQMVVKSGKLGGHFSLEG